MKWNWGTKLVIAMAVFMGFIIILVFQSVKNDVDLVERDYYPKGLKYQDRLNEIENADPFYNNIHIYQTAEHVVIQFPEIKPDTGSLYFFRPSDNDIDKLYKLSPSNDFSQAIPKTEFQKGKYLVKIYWKENDKGFYVEKPYYFN